MKFGFPIKENKLAHNLEAEQFVLGSILFNNKLYNDISLVIKTSDFYDPFHQRLYSIIKSEIDKGVLIDSVVLKSKVDTDEDSNDGFDIVKYIGLLHTLNRSKEKCIEYAHQIKGDSTLRSISSLCQDFFDLSTERESGYNSRELLTSLVSRVSEIASSETVRENFYTLKDSFKSLVVGTTGRTVKTGLPCIDNDYPITTGNHHILGGNTSQGKSLFAFDVALKAALNGSLVHIYSVEMSKEQIVARMVSSMMYEDSFSLEYKSTFSKDLRKDIDPDDWMAFLGMEDLLPDNIIINDSSGQTVSDIISGSLSHEKGVPDLVVVDYLHELSFEDVRTFNSGVATNIELGNACTRLRGLAKDNDIAVLTLAQMNRDPLRRSPLGRPTKHDIEGSGKIEQGADWIAIVYRKAHYLEAKGEDMTEEERDEYFRCIGLMEVIIAKVRMGGTGSAFLNVVLGCNNVSCFEGGMLSQN